MRNRPKPVEFLVLVVFLSLAGILGFIIVVGLMSGNQSSPAYAYAMQTKNALSSMQTPTPFQPVADANYVKTTPTPNDPADQGLEPEPTSTTRVLVKPEGQVNIMMLGSDIRPTDGGFRTDIIVWVSLNPKGKFVSAVSFPRDLYVNIPGWGENRINVAFPRGGFELLADTFEVNFGVRPDHYLMVDFNGFRAIIDDLGGINVQTAKNLTDTCATWINPSGYCSAGPGLVHMNGELALWYARSRYSTNDIDRARRSQEVIEAIFDRLMSFDVILKTPELYNAYIRYVQTDISLGDVIPLLPLASTINENRDIRNYVIGYDQVYDWITPQGAQILVPDYGLIQEVMIEALQLK